MINLVSFKTTNSSENSYTDELFDSLCELILEMRYDVNKDEKDYPNIKKTHFNIFMKNQYKITTASMQEKLRTSSNSSLSINFYLQKKEDAFSLQVESWNFYIVKAKNAVSPDLSNFSRAKVCLFFRTLLCFLTTLPLWRHFVCLNAENSNKKQYFLDHELLVNAKEKHGSFSQDKGYKEHFIEIETEEFFLIFKVAFLSDFSFLSTQNNMRTKPKNFVFTKYKRERFLSEGTNEENFPEKSEDTPVRFFAKWGIEGENISHKKLNNHFKISHKNRDFTMKHNMENEKNKIIQHSFEDSKQIEQIQGEEFEIEVIDSEQDISNKKPSNFEEENDDLNQFELITEETMTDRKIELKKNNSDYMIIGNENIHKNNNENIEKIIRKCKNCLKKLEGYDPGEKIHQNLFYLKTFLNTIE